MVGVTELNLSEELKKIVFQETYRVRKIQIADLKRLLLVINGEAAVEQHRREYILNGRMICLKNGDENIAVAKGPFTIKWVCSLIYAGVAHIQPVSSCFEVLDEDLWVSLQSVFVSVYLAEHKLRIPIAVQLKSGATRIPNDPGNSREEPLWCLDTEAESILSQRIGAVVEKLSEQTKYLKHLVRISANLKQNSL